MKTLLNWVAGLFSDNKNSPSSKRFVGLMCSITLCAALIYQVAKGVAEPSTILVETIALLAFGALGLTSVDKIPFSGKKQDTQNEDQTLNN